MGMRLDSILKDVLGFIGRLLQWKANPKDDKPKPFKSMRTLEGDHGLISLVEGRDTPRAVRSWIFSPKRLHLNSTRMVVKNESNDDLHLYLDFLGPIPGVQTPKSEKEVQTRRASRKAGLPVKTHRVQILKASHFLNDNGFYDYELIFWQDYDFYMPNNLNPDQIARMLIDKLAHNCLKMANPMGLKSEEWDTKVAELWQEMRGSQFAHHYGKKVS
jgi:hypothetical protein